MISPTPDADAVEALRRAWERHDEERVQVEEERRRALAEALMAETTVPAGRGGVAALAGQGNQLELSDLREGWRRRT